MRKSDDKPPVTFKDATCVKETDKALLVRIPEDDDKEHWIPKSQIHDDSEVYDGEDNAHGKLVITHWIAEQRGLV